MFGAVHPEMWQLSSFQGWKIKERTGFPMKMDRDILPIYWI
jgi:hypothetical protein